MTLFVWPPQNINTTGLATEAKQDDIINAVDGVETLIGETNTKLDTLNAKDFATAAKQDTTNTKLDSLIAKDFATETTLQKLREWPYATWDKQALAEGVADDVWTYTSGATVVGTITITYTDATKGTIQDVAYSPVKAV
jgi:hypothetical protein